MQWQSMVTGLALGLMVAIAVGAARASAAGASASEKQAGRNGGVRYMVSAGAEHAYVIDGQTGQVWKEPSDNTRAGPERAEFFGPKGR